MQIRADKVTRMPGWIKSGSAYTFVLEVDNLYLLRNGKYVDFDGFAVGNMRAGYVAKKIAGSMISKMNDGRVNEIEEYEKKLQPVP